MSFIGKVKNLGKIGKYFICLIKIGVAYIYILINKNGIYKKEIWLIQEKHNEARDNGYHLFKFIRTEHPEVNAFYSITKDSVDRKKVIPYGNVINADSIRHYIYYLAAKNSIGSQPGGACPYPVSWVNQFRILCRKDQNIVFLQHGIIKDELPGLAYENTSYQLFVCSCKQEYEYVHTGLHYPESNVRILGLCRFDNLFDAPKPKRQILVMPTFRSYLLVNDIEKGAMKKERDCFVASEFFNQYHDLLTNESLISVLRNKGYKIIFYLHYAFQPYSITFSDCNNDVVIVADRYNYDVQQLMIDSTAMITDYSSVFFDFAYMNKPEVYFQFDEEKYRNSHYKKGYFDYRENGFGPVFTEVKEVVDYITNLIDNDCRIEDIYKQRVDSFFTFHDKCNCKRNFTAIQRLK